MPETLTRHTAVLQLDVEINFEHLALMGDPTSTADGIGHDLLETLREMARGSDDRLRIGQRGSTVIACRPDDGDAFL